jgi:thiol-disulfide isomerase/thioredoxin
LITVFLHLSNTELDLQMKSAIFLISLLIAIKGFSQSKTKPEPLILRGVLTNCADKELIISFRDKNEQVSFDTIRLDEEGKFFLKTYKIKDPQQTSIRKNQVQINYIFVAPGYNLNISANAKDRHSLINSLQISGNGAESNRFRKTLDSLLFTDKNLIPFYKLNTKELVAYMKYETKLRDSLYHLAFDKPAMQDKYHKYFARVVKLDNIFRKLNLLVANTNFNFRFKGSGSLIKDNTDAAILNNLYKNEYLLSEEYRNLIIGSNWVTYLMNMDYLKDSNLLLIKDYKYQKVKELYNGKVKELAIYARLESDIYSSRSLQDLNELNEEMDSFLSQPYNPFLKKSIETFFSEQKTALERTMAGQPAPLFALKTNSGKVYNLSDFKGKVVYMDIWASWCGACREQNPSLKLLNEKYKNDDRIVIIGIDVRDGYNDWEKAMEHDKPTWLQLRDEDDRVWKSYIAYGLPKFIVIDKEGKIVDSNAPWPDSGKEIEDLLNREIAK